MTVQALQVLHAQKLATPSSGIPVHEAKPGLAQARSHAAQPSCLVALKSRRSRRFASATAPATWLRSNRLHIACATQTVKESYSGQEYPLLQTLDGQEMRCLGAGVRKKSILGPIAVQVYAVAAYVAPKLCARELASRARGGMELEGSTVCDALLDGAFSKAIHIILLRSVSGEQFTGALAEVLEPKMKFTGNLSLFKEFTAIFDERALDSGTEIVLTWTVAGELQVAIREPGSPQSAADAAAAPMKTFDSPYLCRALFEVYLGESPVSEDAKAAVAAGGKLLLESETANRDEIKRKRNKNDTGKASDWDPFGEK